MIYKSCRYKGKRMREHRAIFLSIITDKWGWTDEDDICKYMSCMVVHHINGDKTDNRRSNLQIMTTTAHRKLHAKRQKRNKRGRFA